VTHGLYVIDTGRQRVAGRRSFLTLIAYRLYLGSLLPGQCSLLQLIYN